MRKQNKKAILLPESIRIIIAVLCIIILIYLAVSLYGLFRNKTEREQARGTLKQIIGDIKLVNEGSEGKEMQDLVVSPKNWYLVNYGQGKPTPATCLGKSCLCVCPAKSGLVDVYNEDDPTNYFYEEGLSKCDKEGVCQNVEENIIFGDLTKKSVILGVAGYDTVSRRVNFIPFIDLPKVIYITKRENSIDLTTRSYEAPKPVIEGLLKKQVEFNQEKISFGEFLSKYLTKDCEDENFLPSREAKDFAYTEAESYLNELKFDRKVYSLGLFIDKTKNGVVSNQLLKLWIILERTTKGNLNREEIVLCEKNNLIFDVSYVGTFEEIK